MQYAEIPGNSRREFYDCKFPGIPEREFPVALDGSDVSVISMSDLSYGVRLNSHIWLGGLQTSKKRTRQNALRGGSAGRI